MKKEMFAEPRDVRSVDDCDFYHTTEVPGHGTIHGDWDLRGREDAYLGHTDIQGKRVLEVGTASGYLCFEMEKRGAEVVAFDLSENQEWDIVPYAGYDYTQHVTDRKAVIRRINNSFWYMHKVHGSRARVVYESVYRMPEDIGSFDVCTFGAILLHLRDPFLALTKALSHVKDTVIITDLAARDHSDQQFMAGSSGSRIAWFLPDAAICSPFETWWRLEPRLIGEFLNVLGFVPTSISYHQQVHGEREMEMYTMVARRADRGTLVEAPVLDYRHVDEAAIDEDAVLQHLSFSRIVRHLARRAWRSSPFATSSTQALPR